MPTACVIGVGGYSGSGKTTLIENAIAELKKEGLTIGVLKHSHHSLTLEPEEKDTARFFRAGADFVFGHDSLQGFSRFRLKDAGLEQALERAPRELDLIIVEGFKSSRIPRVTVEPLTVVPPPAPTDAPERVICRSDPSALSAFLEFVREELVRCQGARPLRAGLLTGGKSRRMGTPKALLELNGETLAERSFRVLSGVVSAPVLLGEGDVPEAMAHEKKIPDVPLVEGPMAGLLAAFRWAPDSAWVISAVDLPHMLPEAWEWLLSQRRPGIWAVAPRLGPDLPAEAAAACYEPMIFGYCESLAREGKFRLQAIAEHPKVATPVVPPSLARAWKNVNTPEEWTAEKGPQFD